VWHGQLSIARRQLLLGHAADAEEILRDVDWRGAPARLVALRELVAAELALRPDRAPASQEARLERARKAATRARSPRSPREHRTTLPEPLTRQRHGYSRPAAYSSWIWKASSA
jgi:hypothetical protein